MSDIIGAIDGALADWTTSKDAMRWTPEPVEPRPAADPHVVAAMSEALGVHHALVTFALYGRDALRGLIREQQ